MRAIADLVAVEESSSAEVVVASEVEDLAAVASEVEASVEAVPAVVSKNLNNEMNRITI